MFSTRWRYCGLMWVILLPDSPKGFFVSQQNMLHLATASISFISLLIKKQYGFYSSFQLTQETFSCRIFVKMFKKLFGLFPLSWDSWVVIFMCRSFSVWIKTKGQNYLTKSSSIYTPSLCFGQLQIQIRNQTPVNWAQLSNE